MRGLPGRIRHWLLRERHLPTLRLPGVTALLAVSIGVGAPQIGPRASGQSLLAEGRSYSVQFAEGTRSVTGAAAGESTTQPTFAEAVEAVRLAWSRHDASGIVSNARDLLLQLPDADARASVSRDQAIRLVQGVLRRSESVAVRVQTAREVGPGQGYAELVRQYRVTGTDEVLGQRILLAFRLSAPREVWELVELRVLQAGE